MVAQIVLTAAHIAVAINIVILIIGIITLIMKINKNQREVLDIKLDKDIFEAHKKEYNNHCTSNIKSFEQIQINQTTYLNKQNDLLTELVKQNAEMRTDIKWIKGKILKNNDTQFD